MTTEEDRIALIDLDGTIADYDTEMSLQMSLILSPGDSTYTHRPVLDQDELPYFQARRKLIQRQPGFWRNLKPIPRGFEVVEEMRKLKFVLHVLTKGPTSTPSAWSEKVEWSHEHIADAAITISGDKSLVYGRVLFDDWPSYFEKWLAKRPRGLVICLAHSWNEEFKQGGSKEHPSIFRYDGTNQAELVERLTKAYDRPVKETK